jgi:hypothetical protein
MVPISACVAVAVVTVTLSESAHSGERPSPRKPNVRTEVRSEKEASFDVWCFNAVPKLVTNEVKEGVNYEGIPMDS